jgi:hypothetical protein
MRRRHIIDILIVLALFGAYAAGAMLLSAIGADVYKGAAENMEENYDMRTGALYIAEKVRQNDIGGGVRLGQVTGGDALVLTENKSGKGYEMWIYVHDGELREILAAPGANIDLTAGQAIMPMAGMELGYVSDNLLRVRLTGAEGEVSEMDLSPRAAYRGA